MNIKHNFERATLSDPEIERLKNLQTDAWEKYKESSKLADQNYLEFLKSERAYLTALYYERARRAVMTDIFHAAGKTPQEVSQ